MQKSRGSAQDVRAVAIKRVLISVVVQLVTEVADRRTLAFVGNFSDQRGGHAAGVFLQHRQAAQQSYDDRAPRDLRRNPRSIFHS